MSRHLAVVNPAAGGGRCRRAAPPVLERLARRGLDLAVVQTREPGDGTRHAEEGYRSGIRNFVAVGGDGTAFEVLNGALPGALAAGESISLALLPLGTGNSFLLELTHRGVDAVIEALRAGRSKPCDVLRLRTSGNDLFALGHVSFGFSASVAGLVNRRLKPLGTLGYSIGVLIRLPRLRPIELDLRADDGEARVRSAVFVFVNNNRVVGGNMLMAPSADPFDGVADLVWVDPVGRIELLKTFPKVFRGTHIDHPAVHVSRLERLTISGGQTQEVLLDGEVVSAVPRGVEVVPGAVRLVI